MLELYHVIDMIPFLMASVLVIYTPTKIKSCRKDFILSLITLSLILYMVAQSSWFSAFIMGSEWGRDMANWVWFAFNTSVMGVFGWIVFSKE